MGNIDLDPMFVGSVDPSGYDCHLTFDSPCRDGGMNNFVTEPLDFEGDPRVHGNKVDMGSDEFHMHLYCTGQITPGGPIQGKFVGEPGTWPVGLFISDGMLDPPLQHKWGDFYLAPPLITFPLVPIPANGVLEIRATISSAYPAPYDKYLQALIGWELSNLFVVKVR